MGAGKATDSVVTAVATFALGPLGDVAHPVNLAKGRRAEIVDHHGNVIAVFWRDPTERPDQIRVRLVIGAKIKPAGRLTSEAG